MRHFFDAGSADALFTAIDKDQASRTTTTHRLFTHTCVHIFSSQDGAITRRELQGYLATLGVPEEARGHFLPLRHHPA